MKACGLEKSKHEKGAAALLARTAEARVFDEESAEERIARRKRLWSRCRVEA